MAGARTFNSDSGASAGSSRSAASTSRLPHAFSSRRIGPLPERPRKISEVAQDVLDAAQMFELPVERLEPRPDYPDETVVIENAGILALAFFSAAGRAEGVPRLLHRRGDDLAHWLRRVVGPTLSQFRPALHCLSYLRISNTDFGNLDLDADFSHSDLREARFAHAMIENATSTAAFWKTPLR